MLSILLTESIKKLGPMPGILCSVNNVNEGGRGKRQCYFMVNYIRYCVNRGPE